MSEQTEQAQVEGQTAGEPGTPAQTEQQIQQVQQPSHADMFWRYVNALAQAAGVQAFTMAVAVPKPDGTSGIMAHSSIIPDGHPKWKNEVAKLLVTNCLQASMNLMTPEEQAAGSSDAKAEAEAEAEA